MYDKKGLTLADAKAIAAAAEAEALKNGWRVTISVLDEAAICSICNGSTTRRSAPSSCRRKRRAPPFCSSGPQKASKKPSSAAAR